MSKNILNRKNSHKHREINITLKTKTKYTNIKGRKYTLRFNSNYFSSALSETDIDSHPSPFFSTQ